MSMVKAPRNTSPTASAAAPQVAPDQVSKQLKRLKGQLEGIIKMYDDERSCVDIVRQVVAVRGALGRVARELLSSEASRCSHERKPDELNTILKEVFRY